MFYRVSVEGLPEVQRVLHLRRPLGWSATHRHSWDLLIFVLSGKFAISPEGRSLTLGDGMHLLIPAGTAFTAHAKEDCDYHCIYFKSHAPLEQVSREQVLQSLRKDAEAQCRAQDRDYDIPLNGALYIAESGWQDRRIKSLGYRILRCAEFRAGLSPLDRMRLTHSFFKVLISLAATTGEQLTSAPPLSPTLVKITQYIEQNYTAPISLQSLSLHFSLSKQYIMRLFREKMDMTVTQYITRVRLQRAMELLTYHSLSVSEVAYAVGFSSLYYFDRVFKKTYSLTPGEYQRRHRLAGVSILNGEIERE